MNDFKLSQEQREWLDKLNDRFDIEQFIRKNLSYVSYEKLITIAEIVKEVKK